MDLKHVETFLCVCKRKSFSKAAKELYVSQPTVTNHIQALETELATSLIDRSSKNLALTRAGEHLLSFAQKMLQERLKLDTVLLDMSGNFSRSISIISSTIPEVHIVPKIIKDFTDIFKSAKFKVHHFDSSQVIEELENKNYVFGFTGLMKKSSNLKFHKIAEDEMVIIEGKGANFVHSIENMVDATDLENTPFIVRENGSGSNYFLNEIFSASKLKSLNIIAEVESIQTMKQLVMLDLGISFISKNCLTKDDLARINVYTIKGEAFKRNLYFVYNLSQYLTAFEEKFKSNVVNLCRSSN